MEKQIFQIVFNFLVCFMVMFAFDVAGNTVSNKSTMFDLLWSFTSAIIVRMFFYAFDTYK